MTILEAARKLEAIAQTGLHFSDDPYDCERYEQVRDIATSLLESVSNLPKTQFLDWSHSEFGYATPKVDVRAFILKEDRILLVRENQDNGRWTLPGGWADVNDSPAESIVREVKEESGYLVETNELLAVLDREKQGHTPPFPYHIYKIFFRCSIIGGSPESNLESSECAFFSVDALPELSTSRVLQKQILRFYHKCNGDTPFTTDYD